MKALTLHQPWASLVAIGAKRIETRSWSTSYRGPLAIHAALRKPDLNEWNAPGNCRYLAARSGENYFLLGAHPVDHGPVRVSLGCVVATCELVDVVPSENIWMDGTNYPGTSPGGGWLRQDREGPVAVTQAEIALGDYSANRFAWLLNNIVALDEPVPARGRQGLWGWEP